MSLKERTFLCFYCLYFLRQMLILMLNVCPTSGPSREPGAGAELLAVLALADVHVQRSRRTSIHGGLGLRAVISTTGGRAVALSSGRPRKSAVLIRRLTVRLVFFYGCDITRVMTLFITRWCTREPRSALKYDRGRS